LGHVLRAPARAAGAFSRVLQAWHVTIKVAITVSAAPAEC